MRTAAMKLIARAEEVQTGRNDFGLRLNGHWRAPALAGSAIAFLAAFLTPVSALTLIGEKCTGVFDQLITEAGHIKPSDIVIARQMRLACLTLLQLANSDNPEMQHLFCADEAAQAREACRIADAVIESYEAKPPLK